MNNILCDLSVKQQKQCKPQKMIAFLDTLHRKYKILSKLTQKQLSDFQNQVIYLLVDENQNVDSNAYNQVLSNIGLDAFVLQILSKCINRSPFSNAYELKKNINNIAEDLEKQTKQITKKAKILERKQVEINKYQSNLKNKLKQYAQQIQKQCINKIVTKENEIKKNVTNLLNNLKLKEKILNDRKQQITKKLNQINIKQKNLILMQKQQQTKKKNMLNQQNITIEQPTNQTQPATQNNININANKTVRELKQMTKKYEQIKNQLQKLKKKYKTTEMAYNKVKNDLNQKQKDSEKLLQKIENMKQQFKIEKDKLMEQINKKEQQKQKCIKNQQIAFKQVLVKNKNNVQFSLKQQPNGLNQNQHQIIDMLQMLQISHIQHQENSQNKIQNTTNNTNNTQKLKIIKQSQQKGNSKFKQFINNKKKQLQSKTNNQIKFNNQIVSNTKQICKNIKQNKVKQKIQQYIKYSDDDSRTQQECQRNLEKQMSRNISKDKNQNLDIKNIKAFNNYFSLPNNSQKQNSQKSINYQTVLTKKISQSHLYQLHEDKQKQNSQQFINMPNFLKNDKQINTNKKSAQQIIYQIQQILGKQQQNKSIPTLLQSNILLQFAQLPSFQYNKNTLINFFDNLLPLVQQSSPNYYECIQYLSKQQFTNMFQKSYLSYQTNLQIAQATTLLLSRILMVTQTQVKFNQQFINAIKLRIKNIQNVGNKNQTNYGSDDEELLKANINCLLSMVYA